MAETKWTPGGWLPSTSADYFENGATVVRRTLPTNREHGIVLAVVTKTKWERANARLIAAAPDLYDALAEMVRLSDKSGVGCMCGGPDCHMTRARAALAKARGEEG